MSNEARITCYTRLVQELGAALKLPPETNPDVVIKKATEALKGRAKAVTVPVQPKAYVEVVTSGGPDMVFASDLIEVPIAELTAARAKFEETGKCTCDTMRRFIVDIEGYPYNIRRCAVCDKGLGTV